MPAASYSDNFVLTENEVEGLPADWYLSDKLVSVDLPVTDSIPQDCFGVGLIYTQPPCDSDSLFIVAPHCLAPPPPPPAPRPPPPQPRGRVRKKHPPPPLPPPPPPHTF